MTFMILSTCEMGLFQMVLWYFMVPSGGFMVFYAAFRWFYCILCSLQMALWYLMVPSDGFIVFDGAFRWFYGI